MRVVVCTIVHHPADARIYHRQIRALLDAGHEVTYVAPVDSDKFNFPERTGPSLHLKAVPRASGRRRTGALLAARSALARHAADADLLLVHDPELLLALPARRRRPPVIWPACRCCTTSRTSGTRCPPRWWSTWPAGCPW